MQQEVHRKQVGKFEALHLSLAHVVEIPFHERGRQVFDHPGIDRLGARDDADVRRVTLVAAPRVLGTVPGVTYIADQGRPKASEVVAFWPALVSRDSVRQRVIIGDEEMVLDLRIEGQGANV